MIVLTCGVPGAGKTLWTLSHVEARRVAENRPVYFSGVTDCALGWNDLGDDSWESAPDGSLIVIDEAQRLFPVRKQGSSVPSPVRAMETHRHRGIDIYLVSQNPLQVDTAVRHLVGEYRFLDRPFGREYAVIWQFAHVCDWRSTLERQTVQKKRWPFPETAYGWYKSAQAHTHKKHIPRVLVWLPLGVVVAAVAVWYGVRSLTHAIDAKKQQAPSAVPAVLDAKAASVGGYMSPVEWYASRAQYLEARRPRIKEMPESAPVYDQLAVPVTFPRVASCVLSQKQGCKCYTQQSTPVAVEDRFCFAFVEHGAFDPYARAAGDVASAPAEKTEEGAGGRVGSVNLGKQSAPAKPVLAKAK
jgi:zona occludens toxin